MGDATKAICGVLLVAALLVYKLAVAWTPFWLDLGVILLGLVVIAAMQSDKKPPKE
jgi:hypothetical protein